MQLPHISSTLIAIAATFAMIGCGQKEPPKPAAAPVAAPAPAVKPEVTVKIGHVAPLTGATGAPW